MDVSLKISIIYESKIYKKQQVDSRAVKDADNRRYSLLPTVD